MKNITFSIDEDTLKAGREHAREHNISFNALVRKLIQQTVKGNSQAWVEETFALMDNAIATSDGRQWTRDELYRV